MALDFTSSEVKMSTTPDIVPRSFDLACMLFKE